MDRLPAFKGHLSIPLANHAAEAFFNIQPPLGDFYETLCNGATPLTPQFVAQVTQQMKSDFMQCTPHLDVTKVSNLATNYGITYTLVFGGTSAIKVCGKD